MRARAVAPHSSAQLDAFAALAGNDGLLRAAERAARVRLETHGSFAVWQIRLDLVLAGVSDGLEKADCFGALGRRLGCKADGVERAPTVLPIEYLKRGWGDPTDEVALELMRALLIRLHANRGTRWRLPTASERAIMSGDKC